MRCMLSKSSICLHWSGAEIWMMGPFVSHPCVRVCSFRFTQNRMYYLERRFLRADLIFYLDRVPGPTSRSLSLSLRSLSARLALPASRNAYDNPRHSTETRVEWDCAHSKSRRTRGKTAAQYNLFIESFARSPRAPCSLL